MVSSQSGTDLEINQIIKLVTLFRFQRKQNMFRFRFMLNLAMFALKLQACTKLKSPGFENLTASLHRKCQRRG